MRRFVFAAIVLSATSVSAQQPQRGGLSMTDVKWQNVSKTDSSAQFGILSVDPRTGATDMLWRLRANLKGPCEWHAVDQSISVMRGSVTVQRKGLSAQTLIVGGFVTIPKNARFKLTAGPELTVLMASLNGPRDFHGVADEECTQP